MCRITVGGGVIYESYDKIKNTPTIGLYFMAEEYIKFVSNLKYYIQECEISFIDPKEAKHKSFYSMDKNYGSYPIAKLGDVEIAMLHYHSQEEAKEKWNRRCLRVNWDKLIVKMNDQNGCKREYAEQFLKSSFENKVFFTVRDDYSDIKGITLLRSKNKECCGLFDEPFGASRKFNVNDFINGL